MTGIFNSAIFNNGVFNTGTTDTHDGFNEADYRKYRKKIERLAKLADDHNQSKYVRQAVKAAEIVEELQIHSPAIEAVAQAVQQDLQIPELDFSALQAELARVSKYLNDLIEIREMEAEDETIMMMALM